MKFVVHRTTQNRQCPVEGAVLTNKDADRWTVEVNDLAALLRLVDQEECAIIVRRTALDDIPDKECEYGLEVYDDHRE